MSQQYKKIFVSGTLGVNLQYISERVAHEYGLSYFIDINDYIEADISTIFEFNPEEHDMEEFAKSISVHPTHLSSCYQILSGVTCFRELDHERQEHLRQWWFNMRFSQDRFHWSRTIDYVMKSFGEDATFVVFGFRSLHDMLQLADENTFLCHIQLTSFHRVWQNLDYKPSKYALFTWGYGELNRYRKFDLKVVSNHMSDEEVVSTILEKLNEPVDVSKMGRIKK